MRAHKLGLLLTVLSVLGISGSAFAHHGGAAYTSTVITIKGTVTSFEFTNPHSQVYFDVKNDKGEIEHWQGSLTAPNKLARAGWTKHTLSPGDQITISGRLGKNSAKSLAINKIIMPSGESLQLMED